MNKITHIDRVRNEMAETRSLIMEICKYTAEDLNVMQYDAALVYLEKVLGVDEYGIQELPKQQMFWGWWLLKWQERDLIFLDRLRFDPVCCKYTCKRPHLPGEPVSTFNYVLTKPAQFQLFYHMYHRISTDNIYINSAVMEAGYHNLIKRLAVAGRGNKGE